ncbi:rhamnan synthesis F family protein [Aminobacter anthyllidis]|uniref:rhamnan synthesis F family protein n=1 Tax=Aminobacter anthyllidis TaxID=1035067 RepID=UPI0024582FA0|nr:rhamnan synthesis F family protein [Aminobacter anthyllidis]MDH4984443.1 rhamnan synthesis F family protein [Aminobacter anthyllidis]
MAISTRGHRHKQGIRFEEMLASIQIQSEAKISKLRMGKAKRKSQVTTLVVNPAEMYVEGVGPSSALGACSAALPEEESTLLRAAIAVHAFYPDVFDEALDLVCTLPVRHKLFVTTVAEHQAALRAKLEQSGRDYSLYVVQNRGRDVLPFLKIYPKLRAEGFDLIVKVHTKKSLHRNDGQLWRKDVYTQLLDGAALERAIQAFANDSSLGMIGPEGHFVPMATYMGANGARVFSIGSRLGLTEPEIRRQGFFAGTMFMAHAEALDPLLGLAFADEEFEPEAGQIDGTLAHALERSMALSVVACGRRLASTADPNSLLIATQNYEFAKKTKLRGILRRHALYVCCRELKQYLRFIMRLAGRDST